MQEAHAFFVHCAVDGRVMDGDAKKLTSIKMPNLMHYSSELEGQKDFFGTYLPRVDSSLTIEAIQNDYNDGVFRGNIVEFKLTINNPNAVLFQAIKYLSAMRVKGKPIPANILLVSLNQQKAYLYHSEDYLKYIEKIYIGGASKNNNNFVADEPVCVFNYADALDEEKMIQSMRTWKYTKIHIDENCIVGWALSYYGKYPTASKMAFIGDDTGKVTVQGEIRHPDKFKDYIHPYKKKSNERFRYLMDQLNDFLQKKNLGAFYTHSLYAQKSLELVRQAIARVPEGNDYVIIDRCAGTGNLEMHMTEEELKHTIVSTLEYYEYKVLLEVLGDKVRHVIPPTEKADTFNDGKVRGADALSKEFVENEIIMQYVRNPKYTLILFENPPYAETTSAEHQRKNEGKKSSEWKRSFVVNEMKNDISGKVMGKPANDMGNAFIWSAFKYYLRQPTDSYVVFSPVKYWKAQHLINKQFIQGFAFNRRHFHTNIDACIMCALWANVEEYSEELQLTAFDIVNNEIIEHPKKLPVKRIKNVYSSIYYEDRPIDAEFRCGILAGLNGLEKLGGLQRNKPATGEEFLGYMVAHSSGFDNPDLDSSLLVAGRYDGNGFYLRRDNYLEKLPMFAASRYITYNRAWTERARIMKSADGHERFARDVKDGTLTAYLYKCLLFTCLEPQNHMRSFRGSDGRDYVNRLCLDTTHGKTVASEDIAKMTKTAEEEKLLSLWNDILAEAKQTANYNPALTYGLYQIKVELNTSHKDEENGQTVYDYPKLNGDIQSLAALVKDYYNREIVPTLFEYEFLK